jgi:formylmethanofuran dehydrogenase subunit E-like metal-binding protein
LTNALYVKSDAAQLKKYLDIISKETGCSERKGNLLFFHRPTKSPLLTAIFHRKSGDFVVINPASSKEKYAKLSMNRNSVATEDFWVKARAVLDHSDAYSIVSILGSWWLDAPRDFLKSAERHGHVCPGLVFGYFMAKTIEKNYPLRQGDTYFFVANNPTFCGNDAFRVILGVTEEKESLFLKEFSKNQKKNWSIRDGAGVLVKWHEQKNRGQGIILGLDMVKLRQLTGFEKPSKSPETMVPSVLSLIPYLNRYSKFVTVLWESSVDDKMLGKLKRSDNPYVVVGWK